MKGTRLERTVEMYQWKEEKKEEKKDNLGGSTETKITTTYVKDWSNSVIKSSSFTKPEGHSNPGAMPYKERKILAKNVTVGAFKLNESQIGRVGSPVELSDKELSEAASVKSGERKVSGGFIYIGDDPAKPEIGDVRISYKLAQPGPVTLLAMQSGSTFAPFVNDKTTIDELRNGTLTRDAMFKAAIEDRKMMTWIIRLVGFLMMVIGIGTILKPISTLLGVVPVLGKIADGFIGVISFLIGFGFAFITIAIAWVFYRPHIGIPLLLAGIAAIVIPIVLNKRKAAQQGK